MALWSYDLVCNSQGEIWFLCFRSWHLVRLFCGGRSGYLGKMYPLLAWLTGRFQV
jgi:hypothetical protein